MKNKKEEIKWCCDSYKRGMGHTCHMKNLCKKHTWVMEDGICEKCLKEDDAYENDQALIKEFMRVFNFIANNTDGESIISKVAKQAIALARVWGK